MVVPRQILYIALALTLTAGLAAPLYAGDAATARTPMCCLGKGKHHCLGMDSSKGGAPRDGFSKAREKCPYLSLALAAMRGMDLAPALATRAMVATPPEVPVELGTVISSCAFAVRARPERGPPPSLFC